MQFKKKIFLILYFFMIILNVIAFDDLPNKNNSKKEQTRALCVGPAGPTGATGATGPVKTYEIQLNAHSMAKNATTYPSTIINNMFGTTSGNLNVNFTTYQIPNQLELGDNTPLAFEFSIPFQAMTIAGNVPYTLNLHIFTRGSGETEPSSYTVQIRARAAYQANAVAFNPGVASVNETVQTNNISVTVPNTLNNTNHYLVSIAMPGVGATPGCFGLIAIDQPVGTLDEDDFIYLAVADLIFSVT